MLDGRIKHQTLISFYREKVLLVLAAGTDVKFHNNNKRK